MTRLMMSSNALVCDGCGQAATAEHIARRLQRLEWTTRYRPVHISTLLLGAFSPLRDEDFLYAGGGKEGQEFRVEATQIFAAVGNSTSVKRPGASYDVVHTSGYLLTLVI